MDDILIFSKSMVEHIIIINQVLQILHDNDLYLKPEKCEFYKDKLNYLGFMISKDHIAMEDSKVDAIKNWPIPHTVHDIWSFLGTRNFYRRFIENFSLIARPLHNLTKKDEKWNWTKECQHAFEWLKNIFTSHPILIYPNPMQPYRLVTNASLIAHGAVLLQEGPDNDWHLVAYLSGSFSPPERNYDVHDHELLTIIKALEHWKHYLEGARHPFEIWTDHKNLEHFQMARDLSQHWYARGGSKCRAQYQNNL